HVDAEYLISLAKRQPEVSAGCPAKRARTSQRSFLADGGHVPGRFRLAGSAPGVDGSGLQIDHPDAMVPDIADEKLFARRIELDGMRPVERRFGRRSTISGKSRLPGSGHGFDNVRPGIEFANDVVRHLDPIEIAGRMESH